MTSDKEKLAKLEKTLMQLHQNYKLAIREAWIDGFESGCSKPETAKEYSGKHYGNSDFRKRIKQ